MYLAGQAPLPPSTGSCRSRARPRAARRTRRSGCCSPSTAPRRTGSATKPLLALAPLVLNVDHHHDNTRFGDVNLIVADASSTGEVLRDVFAELGVELTPELAEPLYIALVTDTGRFQYANTTPKALRLAAELVEAGADIHAVFQEVYESVEFAKLKLLARALDRAEVLEGGRIVVSHLVRADFVDAGASEPYSEGIIDYLRAVEGAELAVLIREQLSRRSRRVQGLASLEHRRARRLGDRTPLRRWRAPPGRRLLHGSTAGGDRRADPRRLPRATCHLARLSPQASRS